MGKPVIVHARTVKGKGYKIAEGQHEFFYVNNITESYSMTLCASKDIQLVFI